MNCTIIIIIIIIIIIMMMMMITMMMMTMTMMVMVMMVVMMMMMMMMMIPFTVIGNNSLNIIIDGTMSKRTISPRRWHFNGSALVLLNMISPSRKTIIYLTTIWTWPYLSISFWFRLLLLCYF